MRNCTILSGKEVSNSVYNNLKGRVKFLLKNDIQPGLAAILVGENPASKIYIKMKTKRFHNLGMKTETFKFPLNCSQKELIQVIENISEINRFQNFIWICHQSDIKTYQFMAKFPRDSYFNGKDI